MDIIENLSYLPDHLIGEILTSLFDDKPNELILILERFPNKPWDCDDLSENPSITMEDILNHPEKPWKWRWERLSINPNLTMEFIETHMDKDWDWSEISRNRFNLHPFLIKKRKIGSQIIEQYSSIN